jgi:hypothetical protein
MGRSRLDAALARLDHLADVGLIAIVPARDAKSSRNAREMPTITVCKWPEWQGFAPATTPTPIYKSERRKKWQGNRRPTRAESQRLMDAETARVSARIDREAAERRARRNSPQE